MNITVKRKTFTPKSTISEMWLDDQFECYVLEDVVRPRGVKVFGETAIPAGTYNVVITFSNRFQRDMPLLEHVPNFDGIRIHPGNTAADTHGCLLVGRKMGPDMVMESQLAYKALFPKLQQALGKGDKISLTIG